VYWLKVVLATNVIEVIAAVFFHKPEVNPRVPEIVLFVS
jgi:hypothetical protein